MAGACVLAIFICPPPSLAGTAQDMALCVQRQLAELGYDPGPIDGAIGPQTRRAANDLRQTHRLRVLLPELPRLDRHSAVSWCRAIPSLARSLGKYRPFLEWPHFGEMPAKDSVQKDVLERALHRATNFFHGSHGLKVMSRLHIAGAANATGVLARAQNLPSTDKGRVQRIEQWAGTACGRKTVVTGLAFRNAVFFCWPDEPVYDDDWAQAISPRIERVMVHELMHILQQELSNEVVPRPRRSPEYANLGPEWLIEGAAEVMADFYVERRRREKFPDDFRFSQNTDISLRALRKHSSVPTNKAYGVANLAARILARRHGSQALFNYWRRIGLEGAPEAAFEKTFGLSLSDYEAVFEILRTDRAIMAAYVAGADIALE